MFHNVQTSPPLSFKRELSYVVSSSMADADGCRRLLREGIDPIATRRQRRQNAQLEAARSVTFEDCAKRYIEAHGAGWRNAKHADQWTSTLETYAYPVFGPLPVSAIDTALVMKVVEPIWYTKTETATRLRQRMKDVTLEVQTRRSAVRSAATRL